MAAIIQDVIEKLGKVSEGIKLGYAASGAAEPLHRLGLFANKHFIWFLRLILVAYSAMVVYHLFFMRPLFPSENHQMMTLKTFLLIVFRLSTIGIGLYGEFMHSKRCIRIFIILVGLDGMSSIMSIVLVNPFGYARFGSQRETYERLFYSMPKYRWSSAAPIAITDKKDDVAWATREWNMIQDRGCCGINGYEDWTRTKISHFITPTHWPSSCCHSSHRIKGLELYNPIVCETKDVFKMGCRELYGKVEAQRNRINLLIGVMEIIVAIMFYIHYQRSNPDHPSTQLISNHNSFLDMHNAMGKTSNSIPHNNARSNGYPEPPLSHNAYGSILPTHGVPSTTNHHPVGGKHSDTVVVGENTKYKSSAR